VGQVSALSYFLKTNIVFCSVLPAVILEQQRRAEHLEIFTQLTPSKGQRVRRQLMRALAIGRKKVKNLAMPTHSTRSPRIAPLNLAEPAGGPDHWHLDRRDFLKASAAAWLGLMAGGCASQGGGRARAPLRFGLVTDSHYADAAAKGTRHYRESLFKVREAVERLRAEKVGFLAMLGDMKDMAAGESEEQTMGHLVAIEREIQRFGGPTYHVLGNHDMDNLPKSAVVAQIENTGIARDRSYYAFRREGVHFIVLDATYDKQGRDYDRGKFDWRDANIPTPEVAWLRNELAAGAEPVVVLVHQRLDGDGHASIRNRVEVRALLEASRRVLAVFQGHDHPGGYTLINGIHYYTLRAVIEGSGEANNAYAVAEISPAGDIVVTGYRRALSMALPGHAPAIG
jgi:Calcineurin-like phosphoesterase/TAT (twin-arginine translocation) pathway signal sequence